MKKAGGVSRAFTVETRILYFYSIYLLQSEKEGHIGLAGSQVQVLLRAEGRGQGKAAKELTSLRVRIKSSHE